MWKWPITYLVIQEELAEAWFEPTRHQYKVWNCGYIRLERRVYTSGTVGIYVWNCRYIRVGIRGENVMAFIVKVTITTRRVVRKGTTGDGCEGRGSEGGAKGAMSPRVDDCLANELLHAASVPRSPAFPWRT